MRNFLVIIVNGFIMLASGMAVSRLFLRIDPSLETQYMNESIFRPWSDPRMSLYWLVPFINSFILFWMWNFIKVHVNLSGFIRRGFAFGLIYWVITFPGMIMSYSSFRISGVMVAEWTTANIVQLTLAGVVLARVLP